RIAAGRGEKLAVARERRRDESAARCLANEFSSFRIEPVNGLILPAEENGRTIRRVPHPIETADGWGGPPLGCLSRRNADTWKRRSRILAEHGEDVAAGIKIDRAGILVVGFRMQDHVLCRNVPNND